MIVFTAMPSDCPHTDNELFAAIAKDNEQAFEHFFFRYNTKVYYFILHIVGSEAIAEELTQDVFLQLWLKRPVLSEICNPGNYLFVIAKNRSLDQLDKMAHERKLKEHELLKEPSFSAEADEKILYTESLSLLVLAVKSLPVQQQVVYQLSREYGLSRNDIADKLQISPNTVKNHLGAAIRNIQKYLALNNKLTELAFIFCLFFITH